MISKVLFDKKLSKAAIKEKPNFGQILKLVFETAIPIKNFLCFYRVFVGFKFTKTCILNTSIETRASQSPFKSHTSIFRSL